MKTLIAITVLLHTAGAVSAQNNNPESKLAPRELTIPVSPLFDLMGTAPSQVAHTASIKDFKVDWSFKSWRLNPNLAIEAQPVWELFYNRKTLDKYRKASSFQRSLASLDVSLGTVQTESGDRRIGSAAKINLYRQKDPLLLTGTYNDIEKSFAEERVQLKATEMKLLRALDTTTKPAEASKLRDALKTNDMQLSGFYSRRNAAIQSAGAQFVTDNWNSAYIDLAYGKIYSYKTDSAGSLKKLQLNRNTSNGLWLNFGLGIGKRGLVSGLVRSSFYEEELSFQLKDSISGIETAETAVAANKLLSLGINFRYGGPIYNFFVEFLYEGKTLKTPGEALQQAVSVPVHKVITGNSIKWDIVHPYTFNIGGDWRLSRNVILNYGMRWLLDKNMHTVSFTPIANITCMMR